MSVEEFQQQVRTALETVKQGESVEITSTPNGATVAVLVPPGNGEVQKPRTLGLLEGKAKVIIHDNWEMTDEELLNS